MVHAAVFIFGILFILGGCFLFWCFAMLMSEHWNDLSEAEANLGTQMAFWMLRMAIVLVSMAFILVMSWLFLVGFGELE